MDRCVNLMASPLTGAPNTRGGCHFRSIHGYISETVINRGMFTIEDKYKVVCALSNGAAFDDLEWPRIPVSRSQYSLKANTSQTVHQMHSKFGSSLGFSGSADRMALWFDKVQDSGWSLSWIYKNGHNFATGLPIDVMFAFGSVLSVHTSLRVVQLSCRLVNSVNTSYATQCMVQFTAGRRYVTNRSSLSLYQRRKLQTKWYRKQQVNLLRYRFIYATADEADAYMFYRCIFLFFFLCLFFVLFLFCFRPSKNTRQPF